jgi:hypothetical protein
MRSAAELTQLQRQQVSDSPLCKFVPVQRKHGSDALRYDKRLLKRPNLHTPVFKQFKAKYTFFVLIIEYLFLFVN